MRYTVDIDRDTVAEFQFENEINLGIRAIDVDGNQIALTTFSNVLVFTWDEQGSAYTEIADGVDIQPWTSDLISVGLSGTTIAVGSREPEGVFVYEDFGITGGWQLTTHLQPDPAVFPQGFGGRLALDGDTLAVSAVYDASPTASDRTDNSAPGAGAVAVFHRDAGAWQLQAILKAFNADAGDLFGISLALQDDLLLVGAIGEDSAASGVNADASDNAYAAQQYPGLDEGAGAAYVFERTGETWTQTAYLKPSDNDVANLGFGKSVAISGERIAVSAIAAPLLPGSNSPPGSYRPGAVYIFDANNAGWEETAILRTAATVHNFGADIALDGDMLAIASDRAGFVYQVIDNVYGDWHLGQLAYSSYYWSVLSGYNVMTPKRSWALQAFYFMRE